jgi:endonuclease/exonuclease/phosphatase (EEP) superfamily protein YafD
LSRPSSRFSPLSISKLSRLLLAAAAAALLGACATQGPAGAPDRPLRVVTYNVGGAVTGPTPPALVADVFEGAPRADIYVLQEIWSREHLDGIADVLAPAYHAAYAPALRIGALSAAPLSDCRVFQPRGASSKYGAFRCEVVHHDAPLLAVAGVHLDPIEKERTESGFVRMGFLRSARAVLREALTATARSRAAREITFWLSTWEDERVLVAGDFNTVPFTRTIRHMNRHFGEALRGTGDYLDGTYWKVDGRILPRIDFIFYAGALERVDARIIEEKAGDHYPVEADFLLP